jgi:hypothetical protein
MESGIVYLVPQLLSVIGVKQDSILIQLQLSVKLVHKLPLYVPPHAQHKDFTHQELLASLVLQALLLLVIPHVLLKDFTLQDQLVFNVSQVLPPVLHKTYIKPV